MASLADSFTPDPAPSQSLAATFQPEQAAPAQQPAVTSVYHGIANAGGAGPFFSAAIDTALNKTLPKSWLKHLERFNQVGGEGGGLPLDQDATFDQRRQAYLGQNVQAQKQNPLLFGAGETLGMAALPGVGAAGTAAEAATGGSKLAGALASGALAGAETGAGTSASQGLSLKDAVKNTAEGAELGALGGAATHGVIKLGSAAAAKASNALKDKYVQTFGAEVLGSTSKKATAKSWSQILGKEAEEGVEQDAAKKYVQSRELQPVEAAARHGKYDEAIAEIDKNLARYSPGRVANYKAVDEALPFEVGKGLDELDRSLFKAKNGYKDAQAVKALEQARKEWVQDYSSADSRAVQNVLLHPQNVPSPQVADELTKVVNELPQTGQITRTDISKAVDATGASPDAIRYINDHVTDPERGLLHWDPKATIPAVELRGQATTRQKSALQAFDALNPQHSEHTKTAVKKAIVTALEKHLDAAAQASPNAAQAVPRIRQDDVKFSVLLAAKQGLREALEKQQRNELRINTALKHLMHLGTIPAAAGAVGTGQETAEDIEKGNVGQALKHGAETAFLGGIAGRGLYRGASIANNRLGTALANPRAAALMQRIQQRLPGAVAGTVTSTTLGQQGAAQ